MSDVTTPPANETGGPRWRRSLMDFQRRFPALQLLALVVLFVYGASSLPGFSEWGNVKTMLTLASLLALASLGQTLVIILGGLDLSIPGFIVMGAVVLTQLYGREGWPDFAAIAIVLVLALAMGAITGWVCHTYRIQPLIVTLGMGGLAAGGAVAWTGARVTGVAPEFLVTLTSPRSTSFGIDVPPVVVITIVVAVVAAIVMYRTPIGRRFYATGANPTAADLARVNTKAIWIAVFALSAACSALVGVLLTGFSGADQALGDPYLFQGLTAVIVGGTTIMGARGDYTHTVVGALILIVLTTIFVGKDIASATQQIIFGLLILVVVAGYGRDRRLRDRV